VTHYSAVFPGQGSQHGGMGRALHDSFPEARAVFEQADRALEDGLARICFEGSDDDLARTEITQPALLTASMAALRVLETRGFRPSAVAGHSLGEYTALVAAGTLGFEDALRSVRLRGRFMQEAVPVGEGAMAAILGLEREALEEVCRVAADGRVVAAANINGPGQIVVAGHTEAVERAIQGALASGARRAVRLPVSAPFHCVLMDPAARRLEPVLRAIEFRDPGPTVYTNVDAAPVRTGEQARDALLRQVASPVLWYQEVVQMVRDGITKFVEVGPGRVLSGLIRRIAKDVRVFSVSEPGDVEPVIRELEAAR